MKGMRTFDNKQFLNAWLTSANAAEAAAKLGVSVFTVQRAARELRKKGVQVPTMAQGAVQKKELSAEEIQELNALIEEKKGA
jgi:transposase